MFPDTHDVDHALQIAQALFVETINLCRQERPVSTCEGIKLLVFFGDSPLKVSESITESLIELLIAQGQPGCQFTPLRGPLIQ